MFKKVIRQISRSHGKKIAKFDPNSAFTDWSSRIHIWLRNGAKSFQLEFTDGSEITHTVSRSMEEVPIVFRCQISKSHKPPNRRFWFDLTKITRLVAPINSLRFPLLTHPRLMQHICFGMTEQVSCYPRYLGWFSIHFWFWVNMWRHLTIVKHQITVSVELIDIIGLATLYRTAVLARVSLYMSSPRTNSLWDCNSTVYPKKYAHGFCFAVLCCGYTLTDFPISIRLTSLALWQSNDCPSTSKATLMNMDKNFMWIPSEQLHNHNKAKHNKTVCIFLGIYCTLACQGSAVWLLF